ncbi:hypothetical protein BgiBS90_022440, partial [Biomphalaria glabrata]
MCIMLNDESRYYRLGRGAPEGEIAGSSVTKGQWLAYVVLFVDFMPGSSRWVTDPTHTVKVNPGQDNAERVKGERLQTKAPHEDGKPCRLNVCASKMAGD